MPWRRNEPLSFIVKWVTPTLFGLLLVRAPFVSPIRAEWIPGWLVAASTLVAGVGILAMITKKLRVYGVTVVIFACLMRACTFTIAGFTAEPGLSIERTLYGALVWLLLASLTITLFVALMYVDPPSPLLEEYERD